MSATLTPHVQQERCTRYRFCYSECDRCAAACSYGALHLSEEGVAIDSGACRNCGMCLAACPTETFQSAAFSRPTLVRAALRADTYTIACSPSQQPGDLSLPCLGMLDGATVLFLLAQGTDIALAGTSHCSACPHGDKGGEAIALMESGVADAREALGTERWGELVREEGDGRGVDRFGAARRHFFRQLTTGGAAKMLAGESAPPLVPAKAVRAAPHYRPLSNDLIARVVGEAAVPVHPAIAFGQIVAQGACTGCELCERVCPTGALRISESGGEWQLHFTGHCVACGVCIEACQPDAISLAQSAVATHSYAVLHQLRRTRCRACGRIYVGSDDETPCPTCFDDDHNFSALFG